MNRKHFSLDGESIILGIGRLQHRWNCSNVARTVRHCAKRTNALIDTSGVKHTNIYLRTLVRPFVRSFFRSFARWFIRSFIRSFARSFIHLFGSSYSLFLTPSRAQSHLFLVHSFGCVLVPLSRTLHTLSHWCCYHPFLLLCISPFNEPLFHLIILFSLM